MGQSGIVATIPTYSGLRDPFCLTHVLRWFRSLDDSNDSATLRATPPVSQETLCFASCFTHLATPPTPPRLRESSSCCDHEKPWVAVSPSFLCVEALANGGDDSTVSRATPRLHRIAIRFCHAFRVATDSADSAAMAALPCRQSTHNADSFEGSCCLARHCPVGMG